MKARREREGGGRREKEQGGRRLRREERWEEAQEGGTWRGGGARSKEQGAELGARSKELGVRSKDGGHTDTACNFSMSLYSHI
jgi:hypothetical protein